MSPEQKVLLDALASALFEKEFVCADDVDFDSVIEEAKKHSVLPLVFPVIKKQLKAERQASLKQRILHVIAANAMRLEFENYAVNSALKKAGIPYVVMKGLASADYYNDYLLRSSGDIDILIYEKDFGRVSEPLSKIGYKPLESENEGVHVTYEKRADNNLYSTEIEVHKSLNGIPENKTGKKIKSMLIESIETAEVLKKDTGSINVPDRFHHGLILLIHTAHHMTGSGIGLKHLADWAVFVNSLNEDEFYELFYDKLNNVGLWKFACILTEVCSEFLGTEKRSFSAEYSEVAEMLIEDILDSGTFGNKDATRIYQAYMFRNSESSKASNFISSMNEKAYYTMPVTKKAKILLPIGWIAAGVNYIGLRAKGERPKISKSMLKSAERRAEIYKQFSLYKKD